MICTRVWWIVLQKDTFILSLTPHWMGAVWWWCCGDGGVAAVVMVVVVMNNGV